MREQKSLHTEAAAIRLPALSRTATAFLKGYPAEARLAVIAALEAAAVHFERSKAEERNIPEALRPFLSNKHPIELEGEIIGVEEAARRLKVSRQTIYDWIEARRLIGWKITRQGLQIPAEQIIAEGELTPGLERVLKLIPEPRAAWRFLSSESSHFELPQRPIAALKTGQVESVLVAAGAWGESFT